MKKVIRQFCRFSVVGTLSFGIDYGLLFLLTEQGDMHYLVSASCSFVVATVFNYIYSMKYVFSGRENISKMGQFMIFLILSLCGLGLNTVMMRWGVERLELHYMVAKIVAAMIVSIWNFVTRKLFLEEKEWQGRHHTLLKHLSHILHNFPINL